MSPAVAGEFARHGWTKDDIRRRLAEAVKVKARWLERYPLHVAGQEVPLQNLVDDGVVDASFVASDDPDRLLPALLEAEWTDIVIAGDPGRNQSRIYFNNHEQGVPISRPVALSARWRSEIGGRSAVAV